MNATKFPFHRVGSQAKSSLLRFYTTSNVFVNTLKQHDQDGQI